MKEILLYIGLNDKDTKRQEIPTEEAKEIVTNIIGDNTMQEVTGHYTHEDGTPTDETTLKVEIFKEDTSRLHENCEDIKRLLNQESIFVKVSEIDGLFI